MPTKSKSTAIVKAKPAGKAIAERIEGLRDAGMLAPLDANEDRLDSMVDAILNAESEDEVLGGTIPIGQLDDMVIRVEAVNFLPSTYRDHDFAVFQWTSTEGKGVTANGGERLVAQLVKFVEAGWLPATVRVGSAQVEYEEGHFGTTYFFTKPR